jgi:hypothetical protein
MVQGFFMQTDSNLATGGAPLPAQTADETGFSLRRTLVRHLRESVRHYGVLRTLNQLIATLYRLLRDHMPDRRRTHYGDLDFDFDHMVDTTRANVRFRTQLLAALTGHEYFPSEPWLFEQIMSVLPIQFQDFTFIDLGSGKGRSLLMASDYPFRRIVGVEYLPDLHRIAEGNIARYSSEKQQCREIHSICQDARDFEFPAEPTVLYLFNPFPEPVFARVMGSLKKSLEDSPRPFYVAYRYQEYERLLIGCEWLEKIAGTEQWVVYSYRNSGREFLALSS